LKSKLFFSLFFALSLIVNSLVIYAAYPNRPVRLVNPYAAGGAVDTVARLMATRYSDLWGYPVIVDNRAGAGTTIGTEIVARAVPDGNTLLLTSGTLAANVTLYRKLPFNVINDFAPIVMLVQSPYILAIHPSISARSVQEFIGLAKSKSGSITFGSVGTGSSAHLAMEYFNLLAGIHLLHVPFKGGAPSITALLSGDIQSIFSPIQSIVPYSRIGKLRALAISSAKRVELVPELPTVSESGVAKYEAIGWYPILAPKGTPKDIITKVNADAHKILNMQEVKERFRALGMEPIPNTPESLGDYIKTEISRWAKVIKAAQIPIEENSAK
jgi:tripartite-type tricarboxylate transporter receptor subunit TctC